MLEQPVRVLAETPVGRTPGGLHVGNVPMCRPEHPQKRLRMHRAGADLGVERLLQRAPPRSPELGQLQNEALEGHESAIVALRSSMYCLQHPYGSQSFLQ